MPVLLSQVLALADLELTLRTPSTDVARPLRWVAVSEQVDPTPWIESGDLVLTTGMSMRDDSGPCRDYVERLVAAGAAGVGFGVGLHHDDVPAALIKAGEACGLPVVEVGRPVPFVAVSRAVSRLLAAEEYAESGASFEAQRRMIRAVLAGDGSATAKAALPILGRHVRGFALHLGVGGEAIDAWPPDAVVRAADLGPEVDRLRPRGLLASASVSTAHEHVVILPVGARESVRGFLVVGSPRPLTSADQAVLNLAVSLLSWESTSSANAAGDRGAWHRVLLDLITWEGLTDDRAQSVGLVGVDPRRAVAVQVRPHARTSARGEAGPGVRGVVGEWSDLLLCPDGQGGAVGIAGVTPGGELPDDVTRLASSPQVRAVGVSGVSDLTVPANVTQALAQAQEAGSGRGLCRHGDLQHRSVTSLIDAGTAQNWARAYLAPILAAPEGTDLANTVGMWLAQHGQVDAAAQRLGIHRHTVRHRLRRAESALGRSLDDPAVRADLWFALSVIDAVPGSSPGQRG